MQSRTARSTCSENTGRAANRGHSSSSLGPSALFTASPSSAAASLRRTSIISASRRRSPMRNHWNNCITHFDDDVATFIRDYFVDPKRKCLLIATAGLDPRARRIAAMLAEALGDRSEEHTSELQ